MNGKSVLIKALRDNGVKTIFGSPGKKDFGLIEEIKRFDKLNFIKSEHEQTAILMASAEFRYTGNIGVVILGGEENYITNSLPGINYANFSGVPIFIITIGESEKSREILEKNCKNQIKTSGIFDFVNKIEYAFKKAFEEKAGAVHLSINPDNLSQIFDINGENEMRFEKIMPSKLSPIALKNLKIKLESVESPLIMLGTSANKPEIIRELSKFILKTGMPFFSTITGKGILDERLSQDIGTLALKDNDYIHKAIKEADLILSIGYNCEEELPEFMKNKNKEIVHINFNSSLNKGGYYPIFEVVGNIRATFRLLFDVEIDKSNWGFGKIYKASEESKDLIMENAKNDLEEVIMTPRRLALELRKNLDDEDILTLDSGDFNTWFARNYPAFSPNSLFISKYFDIIGGGIGKGIVAKNNNPRKKVVTISSEEGFIKSLGELKTANQLGITLVIIVLNSAVDSKKENLVKIAESMKCRGFKVKKGNDFLDCFKKSVNLKGITVIDLDFNYPDEIK